MVHEREITCRQPSGELRLVGSGVVQQRHEKQGARVVVETIALGVARHVECRMLQHPGAVGHRPDVIEVEWR